LVRHAVGVLCRSDFRRVFWRGPRGRQVR
jgi:hypothetical protein